MSRQIRRKSESGIYHVMLRGINKEMIFSEESDKNLFLQILKKYKDICHFDLYAYCIMNNHVHLLIGEKEDYPLDTVMKRMTVSYAYYYNNQHNRVGHLFQDRFGSEPVDDESYFLTVLRYIHQNPYKAGLVRKPGDYKWSSYRNYQDNASDSLADISFALEVCGHSELMRFMDELQEDQCLEVVTPVEKKPAEEIYRKICGGISRARFERLPKDRQTEIILKCKENGISVRKIVELTGATYYKIQTAK